MSTGGSRSTRTTALRRSDLVPLLRQQGVAADMGVAAGRRSCGGLGRACASTQVSRRSRELQWGDLGLDPWWTTSTAHPLDPQFPILPPPLDSLCRVPARDPLLLLPPSDLPPVATRRLNPGLTPSAAPIFLLVRRHASCTAGRTPHLQLRPIRPAAARAVV
jgi:hypothetical protein